MLKAKQPLPFKRVNLDASTTQQLLNSRICDLELKIRGSGLEAPLKQLVKELSNSGLRHIRPKAYLGDEWFSPEGTQSISIPFWLAHDKLREIELNKMKKVEGGSNSWCMRLLRHETGHCFEHAYEVSRTSRWQRLFGNPNEPYDPDSYRVDKQSRDFVNNLERGYAQSHPDEDFAETFAVCINPNSNWRKAYCDRPKALAKLKYVNTLIKRYGGYSPIKSESSEMCSARKMRQTVDSYYSFRQK